MTTEAVIAASIRNEWIERYAQVYGQSVKRGSMPQYGRVEWMAVFRFADWLSKNGGLKGIEVANDNN